MLKPKAIKGKLGHFTIYTGQVQAFDPGYSKTKPLWTTKLMVDRLTKEDAIQDAKNEIELLESINKHPNSQF